MKGLITGRAAPGFPGIALALMVLAALAGCSSEDKVIESTVVITVVGYPAANGHRVYAGLYSSDDNLLAINSGQSIPGTITSGGCGPLHFYGITTPSVEYKIRSDETYKVGIWIDMNDNIGTVPTPEPGTDNVTNTFPITITGAKEQVSLGLTSASFRTCAASDIH